MPATVENTTTASSPTIRIRSRRTRYAASSSTPPAPAGVPYTAPTSLTYREYHEFARTALEALGAQLIQHYTENPLPLSLAGRPGSNRFDCSILQPYIAHPAHLSPVQETLAFLLPSSPVELLAFLPSGATGRDWYDLLLHARLQATGEEFLIPVNVKNTLGGKSSDNLCGWRGIAHVLFGDHRKGASRGIFMEAASTPHAPQGPTDYFLCTFLKTPRGGLTGTVIVSSLLEFPTVEEKVLCAARQPMPLQYNVSKVAAARTAAAGTLETLGYTERRNLLYSYLKNVIRETAERNMRESDGML